MVMVAHQKVNKYEHSNDAFALAGDIIDLTNDAASNTKPITINIRHDIHATLYNTADASTAYATVVIDSNVIKTRLATYKFNVEKIRLNNTKELSMVKSNGNVVYFSGLQENDDGSTTPCIVKLNYRLGTKRIIRLENIDTSTQVQLADVDEDKLYFLVENGDLYSLNKEAESYEKISTITDLILNNYKMLNISDGNILIIGGVDQGESGIKYRLQTLDPYNLQIIRSKDLDTDVCPGVTVNFLGAVNLFYMNGDHLGLYTYM
jgi:hypothetical protein